MQAIEPRSFFVRVLPEGRAENADAPVRRGYVVELPDGAERWFEDLDKLPALIAAFLDGKHAEGGDARRGEGQGRDRP